MDPWSICTENDLGETLVTVHTQAGVKLITETRHLIIEERTFDEVRPALGEDDIWRKRALIPYLKGEEVKDVVKAAADAEMKQRKQLELALEILPRMPFVFYRLLNKIVPRKRDRLLKTKI